MTQQWLNLTEQERKEWEEIHSVLRNSRDFNLWKRCQTRRIILIEKVLSREQKRSH
ncbi:hypothetical protein G4V62_07215 [Bacillaceae bacterium SIJ1]|uniref:hypothetical protein n=1 Tax=Litoribacterium kuwaitense TaxID=1398745 RepID=UPI0013EAB658|nr:hypothetical protein [Litoribacterium kuwaitense]NGP44755.1 hypothetical protein [Litoribacterium kuwaitense]